jgi:hypothetical protein
VRAAVPAGAVGEADWEQRPALRAAATGGAHAKLGPHHPTVSSRIERVRDFITTALPGRNSLEESPLAATRSEMRIDSYRLKCCTRARFALARCSRF